MNFDSYITSETKTAISLPLTCPPPYKIKGFGRFKIKNLFKKKAFTLAETLITLTIIGVVAALTIPTLMTKYQKHQYVTGLKKAYSVLNNAMQMVPITQGCSTGDLECAGWFDNKNIDGQNFDNSEQKRLYLLSKLLKGTITSKELLRYTDYSHRATSTIQTEDGMLFGFGTYEEILVDINGEKGPNKYGRDRFAFAISRLNILPIGSTQYYSSYRDGTSWNGLCTTEKVEAKNQDAVNCTARVLEEGAMNY